MTEDDTPEALEARCWALRERAERAESERDKALAANKLLVEALEFLMDMQNGPPLVKWEADWNKAMQQAKDALAAVKQP